MSAFLLDVRPILDEIGASIHVVDTLDLTELVVGDERFEMIEPPSIDLTVSNAGEALVSVGHISAPVRATCVRCLCTFDTRIIGEVEGYWPRPGDEPPTEEEISGAVDADGCIDLEPSLVSALVVEAPFAPLHDEECKGLCATCGADLNVGECGCDHDLPTEGPFSSLRSLLEDSERPEHEGT
jgi:uncharacterized protein